MTTAARAPGRGGEKDSDKIEGEEDDDSEEKEEDKEEEEKKGEKMAPVWFHLDFPGGRPAGMRAVFTFLKRSLA